MKDLALNTKGGAFLPKNYKRPDNSKQFLKLEQGENRFRIISSALLGWGLFSSEKKPIRKPFDEEFTADEIAEIKPLKYDDGTVSTPRHFWVFFVWDYSTKSIKVLEVTQASIMKQMEKLFQDEDYGTNPSTYDIVIDREGTGKNDTTYTLRPKPPKPLAKDIVKIIESNQDKAELSAVLDGKYPFENYTFDN